MFVDLPLVLYWLLTLLAICFAIMVRYSQGKIRYLVYILSGLMLVVITYLFFQVMIYGDTSGPRTSPGYNRLYALGFGFASIALALQGYISERKSKQKNSSEQNDIGSILRSALRFILFCFITLIPWVDADEWNHRSLEREENRKKSRDKNSD